MHARVPQAVNAIVVPDLPEVDVWVEIEAAVFAGVPLLIPVAKLRQLVREVRDLSSKAYEFHPHSESSQ